MWFFFFFVQLVKKKEKQKRNTFSFREIERSKDEMMFFLLHQRWKFLFVGWKNFNYEVWILNFVHWWNLFWLIGGYKISCAAGEKNCVRKQDTFSTRVYKSKWMMVSFLVLFFIGSFFFINSGNFYLLIGKILITSVWILNFVHWWI